MKARVEGSFLSPRSIEVMQLVFSHLISWFFCSLLCGNKSSVHHISIGFFPSGIKGTVSLLYRALDSSTVVSVLRGAAEKNIINRKLFHY